MYTSHLKKKLDLMGGREHRLVGVVRECLANNPERRPTTSDLLSSLEEVGIETEGGLLQLDIARVKTIRSLRAKERRIQELEVSSPDKCVQWFCLCIFFVQLICSATGCQYVHLVYFQREVTEKNNLLTQKDGLLAEKDAQFAGQQEVCTILKSKFVV